MRSAACALSWLWLGLGCARSGAPATSPDEKGETRDSRAAPAEPQGEPYAFQAATRSPQAPGDARDDFASVCPTRDAALDRAAGFLAERELKGRAPLDAEDVTLVLRAEGSPYVWPHAWMLSGGRARAEASERFRTWLGTQASVGSARCGTALASADGREVAVAISADVLADLEPLPTGIEVGSWVTLVARLLVPATEARVPVLGPRGRPHAITSSLDGSLVQARFRVDQPGPWLVQLLATVAGGPRPVAEARVLAGGVPTALSAASPAPGEDAAAGAEPDAAIVAMVNGARASERLRLLRRDERLDRVARAHAETMRAEQRLAHDGTDGSVSDRVLGSGFALRAVGENVARAADARHAHRTLWESPSHRSNLLEPSFDTLGVGVARDADGTLWVCEVFATAK